MNLLKKGPEIKLSELKAPKPLVDLYWDLRDRYLLPAVIVLVVAIVAVPLVLSRSSNSDDLALLNGGASGLAAMSNAPNAGGELVAKAAPGLRDYRRRLDDLRAEDPFVQQYHIAGSSAGAPSSETSGSGDVGGEPLPSPESAPAPTAEPPTEPESDSPSITWFSHAIDVRIVSLGQAGEEGAGDGGGATGSALASGVIASESNAASSAKSEATVRRNLPELTLLPSRKVPAAIFIGVTKNGKKALMMISDEVRGIFGDGVCVLGSARCQLLAMEPGLPVTLLYGPRERAFRIEILKLRLLATERLNRAPLGSDKNRK